MKFLEDLSSKFLSYLYGEIDLVQLREWFAPISMDIYSRSSDPDAIRIVNAMVGEFSDFEEGFFQETQLKQNLANALYPSFVSPYKEIHFGSTPIPGVLTGTLNANEAIASFASVGTGRALVCA